MADLPQETLFSKLLSVSEEQGINFLIVGGNAINAYGYQRTTFDIDLAVPEEQAESWKQQLLSMGYTIYFSSPAFFRFKGKSGSLMFPMDLMILASDTFKRLQAESSLKPMGNTNLPIPSPMHLIAMKLHALRQPARTLQGRDLPDVVGLIRATGIDVHSSEFETILQKHADQATRQNLFRILEPD